jgi:hypothetical protein
VVTVDRDKTTSSPRTALEGSATMVTHNVSSELLSTTVAVAGIANNAAVSVGKNITS